MYKQNRIRFLSFLFLFCFVISVLAQQDSLVLGEFKVSRVIDGDTIGVEGLKDTIRFLCIDTEECEKGVGAEERTAEIAKNWTTYVKEQTKNDPNPKFNTPLGIEGKHYAEKMFPIGSTVRIEYDEPGRKIDYYGRNLGYLFVNQDGKWVNYNVECVRAGMSPYSDKYGPSKRFENQFIEAEREARINHHGIWNPNAMAYPNYDNRLQWWNRRGKAIKQFDAKYKSQKNAVEVLNDDDWDRLPTLAGKEVILFGSYSMPGRDQTHVMLAMNHNDRLAIGLAIPDKKVFGDMESKLRQYHQDMTYFRGILDKGIEEGNQSYSYVLVVHTPDQFFVDNPGVEAPEERLAIPVQEAPTSPSKVISSTKIEGDAISWKDAPKHMNEEIIISGKIGRTNNIGNVTFLNFDGSDRDGLTLVVFKENYSKFVEPVEKMYRDHTIKAKGKVVDYKGKPEIVITGPDQIEILE